MRTFFIVTILVAVLVGWTAGGHAPKRPAAAAAAQVAPQPADDPQTRPIPGTVDLQRSDLGHFMSGGYANDASLTFMIDTGATQVVLGRNDAERAGLHVAPSDFDGEASTASGNVRIAHVRLKRVRIGEIQVADVPAVVVDVADTMPLLGQSFLARIDKVAIQGDRMTLTKL